MTTATTPHAASRPPLRLEAGGLEITFAWAGDRWGHRVTHRGRFVVESVEGPGPDGDPRWPASPALQEVTATEAGGRPAIVGVGSAGRSHFSASLTEHPLLPDTVLVELACRILEPAGWLGATYVDGAGTVVSVAAAATDPPPLTVRWAYRLGPRGPVPEPGDLSASAGPA